MHLSTTAAIVVLGYLTRLGLAAPSQLRNGRPSVNEATEFTLIVGVLKPL